MVEWKGRHKVALDACSKYVGGGEEEGRLRKGWGGDVAGKWKQWVLCGYFAHERRVMFENSVSDPMVAIPAILPGQNVSVLLLRIVFAGCHEMCLLLFPELRIRVYVDDMKLFQRAICMDLPEKQEFV